MSYGPGAVKHRLKYTFFSLLAQSVSGFPKAVKSAGGDGAYGGGGDVLLKVAEKISDIAGAGTIIILLQGLTIRTFYCRISIAHRRILGDFNGGL